MDDRPTPDVVSELLDRARAAMAAQPGDTELRQAYDQLVADRTNGESTTSAAQRLLAALDGTPD